ncbi:dTDP-4-dehydrorhamnose 3,5-epimerase [Corynebacterium sp. P7202]|uniref:dTDP-4-dehydrorhamnose 3,5-epimerase n=1 Tax=Corynebacterium pygosceleis TaxID=2800406 RepID=A0A9Q4C860_9CORY|nr:dTDP-4-dehydrorhamnose 3,5-epimerase [Corynebacterium pygosceleis]MCK7637452.1 dTDP-4-dehydrorhamnose 3,5-epimerase [Corynebacterium pygosceleis]MCX7445019.1 dTDP-4-dehydrorhamnose 3,5-epimerase [Corynebacterium pygosceleis]MCX7468219.1 dTDP-4-dehydrorhamnose 3,5-epimerase [Corynebacterium pygosceleis]
MPEPHPELPEILVDDPRVFPDSRGSFHEWFSAARFEESTGYPLDLQQANLSVSRPGVVRGLHFADVPPGQAKWVTCVHGRVIDVVVDVRTGSDTFGRHVAVDLNDGNRRCLYIPVGFAHGFAAVTDATVVYLTSAGYNPGAEHAIDPFDPDLGIDWPVSAGDRIVSEKDSSAPSLVTARDTGILPDIGDCLAHESDLKNGWALANEDAGL